MVGEAVIGMASTDVFDLNYEFVRELLGQDVSSRRKQSSVLGLLAIRNAIHTHLKDGVVDDFSDVLP